MKQLTKDDLITYEEYEQQRQSFRRRIIDLKQRRRLGVGDNITLVFENRDTIQFQVQEMIRVERIVDPHKIQEELDVYNALLPGDGELSATLFIEITDSDRIKRDLDRFQGIDRKGRVKLRAGAEVVPGEFEEGHSKEDKLSAVHFVKFRPSPTFSQALRDERTEVSVVVDHPGYQATMPVPAALRREWLADLGASGPGGTGKR
jgi:Protein of unknown function (DUF3501)